MVKTEVIPHMLPTMHSGHHTVRHKRNINVCEASSQPRHDTHVRVLNRVNRADIVSVYLRLICHITAVFKGVRDQSPPEMVS